MLSIRKIISAGLIAATFATGLAATSTPASAWGYRHHYGWGYHPYGWGLGGLAAGLALGAAAAAVAPVYYGYGACYITRQPVVDPYGNVLYFRRVRVCN
jgi:hypothetical protein